MKTITLKQWFEETYGYQLPDDVVKIVKNTEDIRDLIDTMEYLKALGGNEKISAKSLKFTKDNYDKVIEVISGTSSEALWAWNSSMTGETEEAKNQGTSIVKLKGLSTIVEMYE